MNTLHANGLGSSQEQSLPKTWFFRTKLVQSLGVSALASHQSFSPNAPNIGSTNSPQRLPVCSLSRTKAKRSAREDIAALTRSTFSGRYTPLRSLLLGHALLRAWNGRQPLSVIII